MILHLIRDALLGIGLLIALVIVAYGCFAVYWQIEDWLWWRRVSKPPKVLASEETPK